MVPKFKLTSRFSLSFVYVFFFLSFSIHCFLPLDNILSRSLSKTDTFAWESRTRPMILLVILEYESPCSRLLSNAILSRDARALLLLRITDQGSPYSKIPSKSIDLAQESRASKGVHLNDYPSLIQLQTLGILNQVCF